MRRTAGYSLLDHRRNDILEELKVDAIENKLAQYEQKWLNRVLDERPIRRRRRRRPG